MINFKNLKILSRDYTLSMSITPFIIGFACALQYVIMTGELNFMFFINTIIAFIGIVAAHSFTNIFDDYIDIKNELKKGLNINQINFRSKRKAYAILSNMFSIEQVENILEVLALIIFAIGIYFASIKGSYILVYLLPAAALILFYPVLSRYCLSELAIGLIFGPLLVNGAFYVLTGTQSLMVFELSVAIGLMTTILVIAHSLMDYEHDMEDNKKTLPIVLNKKKTILLVSGIILISYGILIHTFTMFKTGIFIILPIVTTVLIGLELVKSLMDYIKVKDVKFIPKKYYGMMENWEEISNNNYAYYMYRFYLARNIAVIFNITLAFAILLNINPILAIAIGAVLFVIFVQGVKNVRF